MAKIDNDDLKVASEILRALAHPLRLQIVQFIDRNEKINVNKIYNTLKLEQSITSQHLRVLRTSDIVETYREGKFVFYSINYDKIRQVNQAISEFLVKEGTT